MRHADCRCPTSGMPHHVLSDAACVVTARSRCAASRHAARAGIAEAGAHQDFDQLLDLYVRNGDVYYRALKCDRAQARRATSLAGRRRRSPSCSRDEQLAFWLNAYNALVLRTVIDHYPIQGASAEYPSKSIRQIPGAFERLPHRVAGTTLTLDQIEQTVLPEFHDPRVYFALGRGAVGQRPPAKRGLRRRAARGAARRSRRRVRHPGAVRHIDREDDKVERERDLLVAREGVRRRLRAPGAGRPSRPAARSSARSRLRQAQAADDREGIPGEEHLPGRLQAVRLDPERPHRPRRPLTDGSRSSPARVAIVTGSSKGLGLASARALVAGRLPGHDLRPRRSGARRGGGRSCAALPAPTVGSRAGRRRPTSRPPRASRR